MESGGIRMILFDLDGTLLNTIPLIIETFIHVLGPVLGREVTGDEILPHLGKTLAETLEEFCPGRSLELCYAYREYNMSRHDAVVRPYPGAVDLVNTLHQRGYLLGIVSSKSRRGVLRGLDLAGLTHLFDVIVGEEDTPVHKPSPEPVQLAMAGFGVGGPEVMMLGDSPADLRAARAAGAAGIGALWGPFSRAELEAECPVLLLERPLDLLDWCPARRRETGRTEDRVIG